MQTVVQVIGEEHEDTQDEPGAVEVATGATIRDATMVKPPDRIEIDKTDETNTNGTLVLVSTDHVTVGTPDDARGATIADTTEMDPLDVTQRTRYPSLTSMEKDRVAKAPTRDYGNTSCTPTCVYPLDASVWPARRNCARGSSTRRTIPRKSRLCCLALCCRCRNRRPVFPCYSGSKCGLFRDRKSNPKQEVKPKVGLRPLHQTNHATRHS